MDENDLPRGRLGKIRTMHTFSFDILKMLSAAFITALIFSAMATAIVLILSPAAEASTSTSNTTQI